MDAAKHSSLFRHHGIGRNHRLLSALSVAEKGASVWLLLPAAISLALFAWLLTLHPAAAGRVYAAYGGIYVCVAMLWLWLVDAIRPSSWDIAGMSLCLAGMLVIMLAPGVTD